MTGKSDRELLELAARAVGYELCTESYARKLIGNGHYENFHWEPLDNGGDALQLAVMLQIDCDFGLGGTIARIKNVELQEFDDDDPLRAARRVIVRIAAAIGEKMP